MEESDRGELAEVLRLWVKEHPNPHLPTIAYLGRSYSPEDILEEVEGRTELGESLGNFLYEAAKRFNIPVPKIIARAIEANQKR